MLIVNEIEKNFHLFKEGLQKRGITEADKALQSVLEKDASRKELQGKLEAIQKEANDIARQIGVLYQQGSKEEAEKMKLKTGALKDQTKEMTHLLAKLQQELKDLLLNIPNVPHTSVPEGSKEEDNEIIKTSSENTAALTAHKKPHWELIESFDLIDFELGSKVTGAGFPFYKGKGARLVRGLINYFLDEATRQGYTEVQPPIMINEASGYGTGQLPDKEGQMYHIASEGMYMIPTAEVPITNMHRDEIISEDQLPIKYAGHTPCFRREAGSWGAHVRGLNRLHQFDKVELVQIVDPENSYQTLDEMVSHVEGLLQSLELPYRILKLCAGDLGFTSAITYDFEVYSKAQERWLEVSSVSNFETYQSNRMKLRIKNSENKKVLAHTLNGSALALPRIIAALLENNQADSVIKIPKILHPYLGFSEIIKNEA